MKSIHQRLLEIKKCLKVSKINILQKREERNVQEFDHDQNIIIEKRNQNQEKETLCGLKNKKTVLEKEEVEKQLSENTKKESSLEQEKATTSLHLKAFISFYRAVISSKMLGRLENRANDASEKNFLNRESGGALSPPAGQK